MKKLIIATVLASMGTSSAFAAQEINRGNYIEAETSKYFTVTEAKATDGVNSWRHFRTPPATNDQPIVRMNRDTIYSTAVIDTEKGATITLPDFGDRFVMVQFTDEQHMTQDLIYTKGNETIKVPQTTKFQFVVVRAYLPDLNDTAEIAQLNKLQDQLVIKAGSKDDYKTFGGYDLATLAEKLEPIKKEILDEIAEQHVADSDQMFGMGEYTTPEKREQGAAYGWGGATYKDNVYQYSPNFKSTQCHSTTFEDPKNKGFWSFTVYNEDGFMFNDDASSNSGVATPNADGTYTIYFGCDEEKYGANNIPLEGLKEGQQWNVLVRQYAPTAEFRSMGIDPSKTIVPVK
ncbi:hypothetical protein A9260_09730 [Vibrio sp. UCD-FRSSP16_30]|uniref:DUF1254 domain-containing protein n=1 Tax=Vibrio sp. UCD-FRSSP16_30 TaxID=1853258 RepID=UPI0007FBCE38|nr:DUF1254 domain-containing protein [Vibrio sp. UCD-FRSSP16_30]OBT16956.1 hypothetical protein A9260_09730 [Vibrio sp. UCD-FRSSP16_30]